MNGLLRIYRSIGFFLLLGWFGLLWVAQVVRLLVTVSFAPSMPRGSDASAEPALLVFSHVSWRSIWQRNQQTMVRLAQWHKVLYLAPMAIHVAARTPRWTIAGALCDPSGVVASTPLTLPGENRCRAIRWINHFFLGLEIRHLLWARNVERFLTWSYFPSWEGMVGTLGSLGEGGNVYDIQDNYELFPWAPRGTAEREQRLLGKADLVFTGTHSLWKKRRAAHSNIHFYPCGVDLDHFRKKPRGARPFEAGRPILGYYGYIDSRKIDLDLLDYIAGRHPEWVVWMIGPKHAEAFRPPRQENVVYSPAVPYERLPDVLGWFDVALLPYAVNDLTADMNPTKTLEYLASERPVVSTAIPDIVELFAEEIRCGQSHEEFLGLCEAAVADPGAFPIEAGLRRAKSLSWDRVAEGMESHLRALGGSKRGNPC